MFFFSCANVGRPTRIYQLLCTDTRWSLEDLLEAMGDRDESQESGKSMLAVWLDDDDDDDDD